MHIHRLTLGVLLTGLLVLGAACQPKNENTNTTVNSNTNTTNGNTNSAGNVNAVSGTLELTKPAKDAKISSPFEVAGKSTASSVTINIKKADGVTVFSLPSTVRNGAFSSNVTFAFSSTSAGTVEVVESDGTKVSAAVTFEVQSAETNTNQ